jgi:hypothetical protein
MNVETLKIESSRRHINAMVAAAQSTIYALWTAPGAARVIEVSGDFLAAHRAGKVSYARVVCRFCGAVCADPDYVGAVCADDECDGSWDAGALIPEWETV